MSAAEIEAAGVVLVGWWILACYLGICLIPLAPAIRRLWRAAMSAVCRAWRVVTLTRAYLRDRSLRYGFRRSFRTARRHA